MSIWVFLQSMEVGSEIHPVSYLMTVGGFFFTWIEQPWHEVDLSPPSSTVSNNDLICTSNSLVCFHDICSICRRSALHLLFNNIYRSAVNKNRLTGTKSGQEPITDTNYFFILIMIRRWYEDQVASPYSGEQVLSQGI